MIRTSSAQALHDLTESGRREHNTKLILKALKRSKRGLTRREIEDKTGLRVNQVAGRVRELLNQKRIAESGMRKCRVTGNVVNVVCVPEESD